MDFPKRERALPQGSPRRSPKAMRPGAATEADENASPKRPVAAWAASPQRKKVLGERNDGGGASMETVASPPPPQPKPAPSPPTLTGRGAGAYDPKTNYTTPRPEFLRYDPERRREILLRVARAAEVDDCSSSASGTGASEDDGGSVSSDAAAASPVSFARRSDSEAELDDSDDDDDEEEVAQPRRGRWERRLFLLLVAVACSFCYMHCMNPAAFYVPSGDRMDFIGPIGGMYDAGDHEVDSLRLLGPVYMMGPEDVLEETTNQLMQGETEDAVHRHDQRASRNLVAVTMLGLADMCLNVPPGELTCQLGGESSENVADSKEDPELDDEHKTESTIKSLKKNEQSYEDPELDDEHKTESTIESFKKNEQSYEVGCLDGNIALDSIGTNSAHIADMEEGSSGLVHQEEGEDHPNQFAIQLVSMEKAIESSSDKLNLDAELWQYENAAEAAKEICSAVKFLWSAMEPHLLQILACLSVAGFVAAMFRYFQRSREMVLPARLHMLSKSPAEVPVLVPNQIVQLPVYSSEQPTQLTVPRQGLSGSLEVPMGLPLPKPDPFVSLNVPVQEPWPKTDPFVSVKVPADHGKHDQKLQQQDANNMEASNSKFLNHRNVDSSKPPVVELLGEFTFANSARGRAIKSLNQYAGDAAVQELPEKDVDKMQMNSSIDQTPSVRRGRKEENSVKGDKTDATSAPLTPTPLTPTPLRRSNRLRNKVISP
ncbi:hypothetical protein SETIT_5G330200v2 [Setaria italica]|uniref:Uncharacterized protein n=2 Tax=Setaria italica TaxID=4555 RepID=A0A368RBG1_SETIT|nr:uncharacterized protein LOC101754355 [Setaria italica]RCV27506.1 hypothetical protein SETIT_5G330200v2 [Setaria italica]